MKILLAVLVVAFFALQIDLWSGPGSPREISELRGAVERMRNMTSDLQHHNSVLNAEIVALTHDLEAVEELARLELGMIRREETFYLLRDSGSGGR